MRPFLTNIPILIVTRLRSKVFSLVRFRTKKIDFLVVCFFSCCYIPSPWEVYITNLSFLRCLEVVNIENKFLPQEYRVKCGGWDGGFGLECQFLTLMKLTYQILASYYAQKRLKSNFGWWVVVLNLRLVFSLVPSWTI